MAILPVAFRTRASAIAALPDPGGLELELEIPNQDPTTSSMWLVEGRDVDLL